MMIPVNDKTTALARAFTKPLFALLTSIFIGDIDENPFTLGFLLDFYEKLQTNKDRGG
jgi:hypothetical protein